jgi:hypothetical protein
MLNSVSGISLQALAHALSGEIAGDQVNCPGPRRSASDRSLAVRKDASKPYGFSVYSNAGDDLTICERLVCSRLELPVFNGHASASSSSTDKPKKNTAPPDEESLRSSFDDARPSGGTAHPKGVIITLEDWIARDLPDRDLLMGDWLSTTSRTIISAPTGLGKTNFSIAVGMRVASGAGFLHWRGHRPARVLFVDGEMSRRLLKQRLIDETQRCGDMPKGFYALSHEDMADFKPLNTPEGQASVNKVIEKIGKVDLLIADNVMCLTSGSMIDEESWAQTLPWVRSLTHQCIGQIWVHHTGHDETHGYGTKTRDWQMDTVLLLGTVSRSDADISFNMNFVKARERTPATRADFQDVRVALVKDDWTYVASETKNEGRISPTASKFLAALTNVIGSDQATVHRGRRSATSERWRAECTVLGLIDTHAKPDSARTLFSKHRRELIAANRVACEGDFSWLL